MVDSGAVGGRGASAGERQEVSARAVVTSDPELREEESVVVAAGVDATADVVVVVGAGMTTGVAVMSVLTSVAMVTPSAVAVDC